ncbi:MAG: chorismate synthase [Ignavibacteriaceae bacterium]|nr:chorismate synthase [Ignavibacteriaceae bacterium]
MRFLTAGESHGKELTVIIEGLPSNLSVNKDDIDIELARRQSGYGRGMRMKIEKDEIEITSGVRYGRTLGSPLTMKITNRDFENWQEKMSVSPLKNRAEKITIPRPGHADLTGTFKYNYDDIRNSIERSSARETAARVAVGAVAKILLNSFDISVGSFVESIGGIYPADSALKNMLQRFDPELMHIKDLSNIADQSDVRVLEKKQEERIIRKIRQAKKNGDTLGGTMIVAAEGVPVGLGSFVHYDRRLDAAITFAIMSINAIKGVEIGAGFESADKPGSEVHDEITYDGYSFGRKTNRAGGIEGGISTGLPIIIRAAMKPIATLMSPIESVDLKTLKPVDARRERSDFVAVPACAVICEAMTAWTVADFFLQKFSGDSMEDIKSSYAAYKIRLQKQLRRF